MTTTNRALNVPTRGSETGTWDTPVNANFNALDTMLGGVLSTSVSSGAYNLSSTAYAYGILRFTGALSGNVTVTLPSKSCFYIIDNQTTGASYYVKFTAGGSEDIAVPQGKATDIFVDGSNNVKFRNSPDPGTYWDYAGATAPVWIAACTKVPWLVADGSTFLIATHPHLAAIMGTAFGGDGITTSAVPDHQNRVRVPLKASAPRLTSAGCGINGSTRGAAGGAETETITQAKLPNVSFVVDIPAGQGEHDHDYTRPGNNVSVAGPGVNKQINTEITNQTSPATLPAMTGTAASGGSGTPANITQPTLVHGLTFVKT